ncbi:rod shape-determining protein MreC [Agitococcus lubricus]|uniref:Cell shape-determining protein MreC n=1 Tax=Agitococcus lubricus TaxID=1077255 RepID=A0A2T5ITP4_9GAMM|nr:rod shape-determining protein MreC [Agitococcus lubricus]PTQ87234.1 rod shape-determining protein MreC [Agitococcus lubricus]
MRDIIDRDKRRFEDIPAEGYRLVVAVLLCTVLIAGDTLYPQYSQPIRQYSQQVIEPFVRLLSYPARLVHGLTDRLRSQKELYEENKILQAELLQNAAQLQQLAESRAENSRLRALLQASLRINDHILNAEIISIDPNPYHRVLILNKGTREGMELGLPVLDADGIMGQVIQVTHRLSSVMLISDPRHSIPVRIERNEGRAILTGMGDSQRLKLDYVPETVDIKVGDKLISSGLGRNFPAGHPVAIVSEVKRLAGREFVEVYARPVANLDHSRHVIVLFRRSLHDEQPTITPLDSIEEVKP